MKFVLYEVCMLYYYLATIYLNRFLCLYLSYVVRNIDIATVMTPEGLRDKLSLCYNGTDFLSINLITNTSVNKYKTSNILQCKPIER